MALRLSFSLSGTDPSASITTGLTFVLTRHFFRTSLARSCYFSIFLFIFIVIVIVIVVVVIVVIFVLLYQVSLPAVVVIQVSESRNGGRCLKM